MTSAKNWFLQSAGLFADAYCKRMLSLEAYTSFTYNPIPTEWLCFSSNCFRTSTSDVFISSIVAKVLEIQFPEFEGLDKSLFTNSVVFGAILGQLIFGFLADHLGRR